jgi:hypothetical protein
MSVSAISCRIPITAWGKAAAWDSERRARIARGRRGISGKIEDPLQHRQA